MVELVLLIGYIVSLRFRTRNHAATIPAEAREDRHETTPSPVLSEKSTLAGVPLWILKSERSSPGELLRDTLLTRPSRRDDP